MISPEGIERTTEQSLFPLDKDSVQAGINWVHKHIPTPDQRNYEMHLLQKTNPSLYSFIKGMGLTRNELQFGGRNIPSYENGALFMLKTLQNQIKIGNHNSHPTKENILSYFQDLLDIEFNRRQILIIDKEDKALSETG